MTAIFLFFMGQFAFSTYLPTYLKDVYSFDLTAAGTRTAGFAIAAVLAVVRARRRREVLFYAWLMPASTVVQAVLGGITVLTGLTTAMVRPAPTVDQVLPSLLEFIGDAPLIAHNAGFDFAFLDAEMALHLTDHVKLAELGQRAAVLAEEREALEMEWLEAAEVVD